MVWPGIRSRALDRLTMNSSGVLALPGASPVAAMPPVMAAAGNSQPCRSSICQQWTEMGTCASFFRTAPVSTPISPYSSFAIS